MSLIIDSSLWVDFLRAKTPAKIKQQVVPLVNAADAVICEPIKFEILRAALRHERTTIESIFATLPTLPTPADLWERSAALGQKCLGHGFRPPAMDLLIAQIAIEHQAELVTFDAHFAEIAKVSSLKTQSLERAS